MSLNHSPIAMALHTLSVRLYPDNPAVGLQLHALSVEVAILQRKATTPLNKDTCCRFWWKEKQQADARIAELLEQVASLANTVEGLEALLKKQQSAATLKLEMIEWKKEECLCKAFQGSSMYCPLHGTPRYGE